MERGAADRRAALFKQLSALNHVRNTLITETRQCKDVFEKVGSDFGQQALLVQDQRKLEINQDAQRAGTLGFRALQQGDFAVAQANFRTAWQLQPAPSTFTNLVIGLASLGQDVEARQLLDKHVPSEANPAHIRLLDAWAAWKAGDSSTALEKAEAALESAPEDHALRELASCAAWTLGFEARALEHLSKLGHPVVPQ
jgi:thioredoxin-like negative regulator of GroEL